jgi:ATP-dependent RNA helicase RhlE
VEKRNKPVLLTHLLGNTSFTRALVFTRTKHGADRVARQLHQAGIHAAAIHGNKSQPQRQRALEGFRSGQVPVLIASDIAARGIDIDEISHVINYDLPNVPETYVHRIGRTARAGAAGAAIAFCDHEEKAFLKDIERLTRISIPVRSDHPPYPSRAEHDAASRADGHRPVHAHPRQSHHGHSPSGGGSPSHRQPVKPSPGGHHPSGGTGAGPRKPGQTTGNTAPSPGAAGGDRTHASGQRSRRRRRW